MKQVSYSKESSSAWVLAALCCGVLAACAKEQNLVSNAGFELGAEGKIESWILASANNDPGFVQFSLDKEGRTGKSAGKITHSQPNDSSFDQEISIKENTIYRVSGWIRTDGVEGGRLGAHLAILPGGVRSASVKGNQLWTPVELYLKTAPGRDRLRLGCRLGSAQGAVKGAAWFDDIKVEEARPVTVEGIPTY